MPEPRRAPADTVVARHVVGRDHDDRGPGSSAGPTPTSPGDCSRSRPAPGRSRPSDPTNAAAVGSRGWGTSRRGRRHATTVGPGVGAMSGYRGPTTTAGPLAHRHDAGRAVRRQLGARPRRRRRRDMMRDLSCSAAPTACWPRRPAAPGAAATPLNAGSGHGRHLERARRLLSTRRSTGSRRCFPDRPTTRAREAQLDAQTSRAVRKLANATTGARPKARAAYDELDMLQREGARPTVPPG